jgi:hypothetical protein
MRITTSPSCTEDRVNQSVPLRSADCRGINHWSERARDLMSAIRIGKKNKSGTNLQRDCCSRGCANVVTEKETTQCREQEPRFRTMVHQY